ncbi:hypothetical protein ACS15_1648 [Ralstonia insidiosa]|uniref:Uncharacterized protein n=1 Tax=Ralstonia insidiosa TaxID=190721 RepID=A0AAC9FSF7_9RALS|nr:hypothetical protein ACS15_1648 [Ralstonia insidiosa]
MKNGHLRVPVFLREWSRHKVGMMPPAYNAQSTVMSFAFLNTLP